MAAEQEKEALRLHFQNVLRELFLVSEYCKTEEQRDAYNKSQEDILAFEKMMYENNNKKKEIK